MYEFNGLALRSSLIERSWTFSGFPYFCISHHVSSLDLSSKPGTAFDKSKITN